ncbi:recombination protein U [Mycoplasmopsis mustelae]|uniref:Holliday junction resolvase RecU n=1 Tax=Mycoplasmopsis mustelae TaxID=171289 RepID=A0A4R7UDW0_9BACT|nr:Holliday junction resolvase RecU [Mycoplasmopsis mustelae]TDV24256.1 recombination protein U [Mycoplasmopsis mustelae]
MMKNRGMFLESVLNKTIEYFWTHKIAFIEKKGLDIALKTIIKEGKRLVVKDSNIYKKSTVDYTGCYKGSFICFEAKSCNEDRFDLSNLKEHQLQYLHLIQDNGGYAFVVLFFSNVNRFFQVKINYLQKLIDNKIKSVKLVDIEKNSKELSLEFPCILNFLED